MRTTLLCLVAIDLPSRVAYLTHRSLSRAVVHLTRRDRDLARIVRTHGTPPLWARRPGFATLAQIILEQQVSLAAARTLYWRLSKQFRGGWTPVAIVGEGTTGLHCRRRSRGSSALNGRSRTRKRLSAHHNGRRTAPWRLASCGVGIWANGRICAGRGRGSGKEQWPDAYQYRS